MESSQKRVIMFEYLKNIIGHRAILLLQEVYSSIDTENNGMTILRVNHTTEWQFWGLIIQRNVNVVVTNQFNVDNGYIFNLGETIDDTEYLLMNYGLSKEYYETLWEDIKDVINSLKEAKIKGSLSISQIQVVIKFSEVKDWDKQFIKNWKPVLLLNADTKMLLKAFAGKFKLILPSIILLNQIAYAEKWCISESGRLISDIIELCGNKNVPGF